MAIGDAAAAKGLVVYPNTQAHSLGYQNDNQRGDELAAEIDARIAGDALAFPVAKVIYTTGATPAYVAGAIWLKKV